MLEPVKGPDVNVGTLRNIEEVLRDASVPVSRYFILKQLERQAQGTTQPRLNAALRYLFDHDLAMEGERGIQWVHSGSPSLRHALATGRRV